MYLQLYLKNVLANNLIDDIYHTLVILCQSSHNYDYFHAYNTFTDGKE